MTLALDFPESCQSPLGRMDARWKLAALVLAAVAVALLRSLYPSLIAMLGAFLLALMGWLPLRWYLVRLGWVALFLAFFLIWLPFFYSDGAAQLDFGWIELSRAGTILAAVLLLKGLTVVSLMLVLFATAPIPDTFKAAHSLRVPGVFVHIALLTYRYIFLFAEEFVRLRTALRVRGYRSRGNWRSYRTIGQVAGTLLVRSFERSERVAQAMGTRGFDGTFRSLHDFRTRLGDVAWFAAIAGSAAGLALWDFLQR